jgi:hypothetical protein
MNHDTQGYYKIAIAASIMTGCNTTLTPTGSMITNMDGDGAEFTKFKVIRSAAP